VLSTKLCLCGISEYLLSLFWSTYCIRPRTTTHAYTCLVLPRYGDAASVEFAVERVIAGVEADALHRAELLNVENIFAVDGARLQATTAAADTQHGNIFSTFHQLPPSQGTMLVSK